MLYELALVRFAIRLPNFRPYLLVIVMKLLISTILMLLPLASISQTGSYLFTYQIDSLIRADSSPFRYQFASWYHSFIGNYYEAIKTKELQSHNVEPSNPSLEQKTLFCNYNAIDARSAILKEASKTRILIINEAHHMPLHRVYLSTLLGDLYRIGYRFLGMEGLFDADSLLNQRMYPVLTSGFYVLEPSFGNLIRRAIEQEITVFPYEQKNDSVQKTISRELAQAMNIKEQIDRYPKAKFIIYCGYAHVAEDTLKNLMGLPMAGHLKRLTGIDPFTIDQTALSEYFVNGNRYRKLIKEKSVSVFADRLGNYFNAAGYPNKIDCNLYHPDTKLSEGRPSWLKTPEKEFVYLQEQVHLTYPYLLEVYLKGEDIDHAVPIDIIEVKSADDKVASVVFRQRDQIAVAIDKRGQVQIISLPNRRQ